MKYNFFIFSLLPVFIFQFFSWESNYLLNKIGLDEFQKIDTNLDQNKPALSDYLLGQKQSFQNQPARTPRPTATPVIIPPPADPHSSNLIVIFGILTVIIVLVGVWINRNQLE